MIAHLPFMHVNSTILRICPTQRKGAANFLKLFLVHFVKKKQNIEDMLKVQGNGIFESLILITILNLLKSYGQWLLPKSGPFKNAK